MTDVTSPVKQKASPSTAIRSVMRLIGTHSRGTAGATSAYYSSIGCRSGARSSSTLRGLLLTSYGFSEFGAKAEQAAMVAYAAAGLLLLLGLAGLIHAFMTPKTRAFAAPEKVEERVPAIA